jgi:L-2,4-diaminobutyric acid acetyltransferase
MLQHLLARDEASSTRYLETTVSPSNTASRRMFQRFADLIDAPVNEQMLFDRDAFGNEDHEEEVLLKIGPFETGKLREVMP